MCQSRPGPRCSNHASKALSAANGALKRAEEDWNAVKNARTSDKKTASLERLESCQERFHSAEKDYYSTTRGIDELRSQVNDTSLSMTERAQVEARLELAEYDRNSQVLAHKLYQGKRNLSSAMVTQHKILKLQEQEQAKRLANALNAKGLDGTFEDKLKMRQASSRTALHEENMRLRAVGVTEKPQYSYLKDVTRVRNENNIYLPLKADDFGRARDYFPYGAYGKITEMRRDSSGNLEVNIEGQFWRTVNGYQKVMHVKRNES